MLTGNELKKVQEEFFFWEQNYFNICINKKLPDEVPDNEVIIGLLNEFKVDHDYYAIMHRRSMVKKIYTASFIENFN